MVLEHVSGDIENLEDILMLKLCGWHSARGSEPPPFTMTHARRTSRFWSYCADPRLRFVAVGSVGGMPMHYGHFTYGSSHIFVVQDREGCSSHNDVPHFSKSVILFAIADRTSSTKTRFQQGRI